MKKLKHCQAFPTPNPSPTPPPTSNSDKNSVTPQLPRVAPAPTPITPNFKGGGNRGNFLANLQNFYLPPKYQYHHPQLPRMVVTGGDFRTIFDISPPHQKNNMLFLKHISTYISTFICLQGCIIPLILRACIRIIFLCKYRAPTHVQHIYTKSCSCA